MKILLVRPPQISPNMGFPAGPKVGLPLGLLYIASVLEKEGFRVEILDALADFALDGLDLNKEWIHFGLSWEKIEERIKKSEANVVGINNPFSSHLDSAIKGFPRQKDSPGCSNSGGRSPCLSFSRNIF